MLSQSILNLLLAPDSVFVEEASIARNVKRQLLASLGEKDGRFAEGVSVAEFVEDVLVRSSDLCDYDLCFDYPLRDVLENDSRPEHFARVVRVKTELFRYRLNHVRVKLFEGLGELHHDKHFAGRASYFNLLENHPALTPSEQPDLAR